MKNLNDIRIGFIGVGNMGLAMIRGIVNNSSVMAQNINVSDVDKEKLENISEQYGVNICTNNLEVAEKSDYVVLSIKPQVYEKVLNEISSVVKYKVIISLGAGVTIRSIKRILGQDAKVVRTMPNAPALVGFGMTAVSVDDKTPNDDIQKVISLFMSFGEVEEIEEGLLDCVTAISGSSPAYVCMFIEAMADAAVLKGMSRDKAYRIASQAVLGTAKMLMDTGLHPSVMKDMVCSPGGTTIEAVYSLEKSGFSASVMEAVKVCADKAKKMGLESVRDKG